MGTPVAMNRGSEAQSEVRNSPGALDSLLKSLTPDKQESMDLAGEPEPEVRSGASALDSILKIRSANHDPRQDPGYLPEPEPKVRSGASTLDSILKIRSANHDPRQDPGYLPEPEPKVRIGASALESLLEGREVDRQERMDAAIRSKPESHIAATAPDSALNALDDETGTLGAREKGRRFNPDRAPADGGRENRRLQDGNAGQAVAVVQDVRETAKHVEEKMSELVQLLGEALAEEPMEGAAETAFREELRQLVDAINLETTHTLLGAGGQDLKIALGDGTVDVLSAENVSLSLEGEDPGSERGLEALADRVRGQMSTIKAFQRKMDDQLQRLADSNDQIAAETARDMGVDPAELDPESAAQLASQVAGQMVGKTMVMMNLDLDHQAKRIAGLLRSPV